MMYKEQVEFYLDLHSEKEVKRKVLEKVVKKDGEMGKPKEKEVKQKVDVNERVLIGVYNPGWEFVFRDSAHAKSHAEYKKLILANRRSLSDSLGNKLKPEHFFMLVDGSKGGKRDRLKKGKKDGKQKDRVCKDGYLFHVSRRDSQ